MDERIRYAFEHTEILKRPKQLISTFGTSVIHYYVLTEPVYSEFTRDNLETVVREGKVSWYQPKLLTPTYMFIIDMMARNVYSAQITDFTSRGVLGINQTGQATITKDRHGVPVAAREEIEKLFKLVKKGDLEPIKLKKELDNWGLFEYYQDRFFSLFKKK